METVLRGRRGNWAGSGGALGPVLVAVTPRHFARQAWHLVTSTLVLRGRRGAWSHPLSFRVAGVAHGDIDLGFAWQAWHLWHWTCSGCALGPVLVAVTPRHFAWQAWHLVTSTFVLRGRRGTYGTWSHPPSFCVVGVAHGDIDRGFAWQVCHLWHWTGSAAGFSRRDAAALCVAGVALGDIHLRFAWQAWHLWPLVTYTFVSPGKRGTW